MTSNLLAAAAFGGTALPAVLLLMGVLATAGVTWWAAKRGAGNVSLQIASTEAEDLREERRAMTQELRQEVLRLGGVIEKQTATMEKQTSTIEGLQNEVRTLRQTLEAKTS